MKCLTAHSPAPTVASWTPPIPLHNPTLLVPACGRLCLYRKKVNLSRSLAGQAVGINEADDGIWLVSFMDYDLGDFDMEEKLCSPSTIPSGPKCHLCLRNQLLPMCPERTNGEWCRR